MNKLIILFPLTAIILITVSLLLLGIRIFVITSGSMEPKLARGDIIFVQKKENYRIGEVISYKTAGNVVTHQVIAKHVSGEQVSYQTKGSANTSLDDRLIEHSAVIGTVFHAMPKIGLILLLPKKLYLISCMWLISMLIIGLEVQHIAVSIGKNLA